MISISLRLPATITACLLGFLIAAAPECQAQETVTTPEVLAARKGKLWRVPVSETGPTRIPRVCASLRAAYFEGMPEERITVQPDIHFWELKFGEAAASKTIVLEFDSFPFLPSELKAIEQKGDGTLTLNCASGQTTGSKLRFEPQPHKNTIGYWADPADSVSWAISISKPGSFNVGVLQGAGGSGGGTARVSLVADEKVVDSLDFKVQVTGHYQNFVWNNSGVLTATEPGDYQLKIEALKIDKAALMDVRQVHLSPKR